MSTAAKPRPPPACLLATGGPQERQRDAPSLLLLLPAALSPPLGLSFPFPLSDLSLPEAPVAVDPSPSSPPRPCRQLHKNRRELLFPFPLFPRPFPSSNPVSRRSPKVLVAGHVVAVVVVPRSRDRAQK